MENNKEGAQQAPTRGYLLDSWGAPKKPGFFPLLQRHSWGCPFPKGKGQLSAICPVYSGPAVSRASRPDQLIVGAAKGAGALITTGSHQVMPLISLPSPTPHGTHITQAVSTQRCWKAGFQVTWLSVSWVLGRLLWNLKVQPDSDDHGVGDLVSWSCLLSPTNCMTLSK